MQSHLQNFQKGLVISLGLGLGMLCFVMIAYAFSTWSSGVAPQASPLEGNVALALSSGGGGCYGGAG